jgi:proteasome accessory factor B
VDRLERLTDLVLVLLRPGPPQTLAEIAEAVPGYPPPGEARRQAFERDKRTLRDQGIVVRTEPVPGPEQVGYRIHPEDFYLPDLDLAPDEQVALNLAVAAVHVGDGTGQQAMWRLGAPGGAAVAGPSVPLASLPDLEALPALFDAVRQQAEVVFAHRGERRRVAPAQLRFLRGWWYLVGWDLDRDTARTFRVDRIEGAPTVGAPGSGRPPADFDPATPWSGEPWQAGEDEPVEVTIWADAVAAARVVAAVGPGAPVVRGPDGEVEVRLQVTNVDALRTWLLDLGEHAEVRAPAAVRDDVVAWLTAVASS